MEQRQRARDPDHPWSYSVDRTEERYGEDREPARHEEKRDDGAYDRQTGGASGASIGCMLHRRIGRSVLRRCWNLLALRRRLRDLTSAIRRHQRGDGALTARAREDGEGDATVDEEEEDAREGDDRQADVEHAQGGSFVEQARRRRYAV